jgi:hypothetical protein
VSIFEHLQGGGGSWTTTCASWSPTQSLEILTRGGTPAAIAPLVEIIHTADWSL